MIAFIFLNDEIREYIESEKKKRKAAEAAIVNDTIIDDTLSNPSPSENSKSESSLETTDINSVNFDNAVNADDEE